MEELTECEFPCDEAKNLVDNIAKRNSFKTFQTIVTPASKNGDNHVGSLYRVHIIGQNDSDKDLEMKLIIKVAKDNEKLRCNFPLHQYFIREVKVYKSLFPLMAEIQKSHAVPKKDRFTFAKCYEASSEEFNEIIILEDLAVTGFQIADRFQPLDFDHVCLALKTLARFHALSFVMKKQFPQKFLELSPRVTEVTGIEEIYGDFINSSKTRAIACIENIEHKETLTKYISNIVQRLINFANPKTAEPYNIICHGDCWVNNMMFKYDENNKPIDIKLIDFQNMRNSSPIVDTSYLLFTSTDREFVEEHYEEVLDYYYACLKDSIAALNENIDACYPESAFREHIRTYTQSGLCAAVCSIPTVLSEKDNELDLGEVFENEDSHQTMLKYSKRCTDRIRGIVQYFIEKKFI